MTVAKGQRHVTLTGTYRRSPNQPVVPHRRPPVGTVGRPATPSAGQLIARLDPQNEESGLLSARAQPERRPACRGAQPHADARLVVENAVSRASFDQAEAPQTAQAQVESAQPQVTSPPTAGPAPG
jgi:hypothetical protein